MTAPTTPVILIVSGSRWFRDEMWFAVYMSTWIKDNRRPDKLVTGDEPRGTDAMAKSWAEKNGVPVEVFTANWRQHGRAAGPVRNGEMIKRGTHMLAFPARSGKGTQNAVKLARKAGLPTTVTEIDWLTEA